MCGFVLSGDGACKARDYGRVIAAVDGSVRYDGDLGLLICEGDRRGEDAIGCFEGRNAGCALLEGEIAWCRDRHRASV